MHISCCVRAQILWAMVRNVPSRAGETAVYIERDHRGRYRLQNNRPTLIAFIRVPLPSSVVTRFRL
jgi:hypothetical protein